MDDINDDIDTRRIERTLRQAYVGVARDPLEGQGVVFDLPGDL